MKYILFCFGMKYYALIICWKIANVKIWPSLHEIKQSWWMLTRTKTSNILNFFKKMKIFSWLSFNFDVFFTGWLFNFCRQVLVWPRKSCMSTCISNKNLFFNYFSIGYKWQSSQLRDFWNEKYLIVVMYGDFVATFIENKITRPTLFT